MKLVGTQYECELTQDGDGVTMKVDFASGESALHTLQNLSVDGATFGFVCDTLVFFYGNGLLHAVDVHDGTAYDMGPSGAITSMVTNGGYFVFKCADTNWAVWSRETQETKWLEGTARHQFYKLRGAHVKLVRNAVVRRFSLATGKATTAFVRPTLQRAKSCFF